MSRSNQLPDWTPAPVREVIGILGWGDDVSSRLLTDQRMRKVWDALADEMPKAGALEDLDVCHRNVIEAGTYASPSEKAMAAMYAICADEMRKDFFATKATVEKTAKKWRDVAVSCRTIGSVDLAPSRDPELAAALERTAKHFDHLAEWLVSRNGPRWLNKANKSAGHDEKTRARACALIAQADGLYAKRFRTPLAVMTSVALQKTIDAATISNWRSLM